jgi:uncharacterized OB-fold protein
MVDRPLPRPSALTEPFWDAARSHELRIQHCLDCGHYIFYPRYLCPDCGGDRLEWKRVSGRGTVFTYTVARKPTHPAFADRVPYVIAVVELEEGPKLTTNIVGIDPEDVSIGLPVQVAWEDAGDIVLVDFEPRER